MSKYITESQDLTAVANAIRSKSGSNSQLVFPDGFVSQIRNIVTDEEENEINDVTFVDYDGTIVHTYSADEFLALDTMPSNPSHEGLIAQGWNWDLADAKTYVQNYHCLCIGQNYTTSDGKTRVYIVVTEKTKKFNYSIGISTLEVGGVTISWGDGTTTVTDAGVWVAKNYLHKYSTAGEYVITIEATSGRFAFGKNGSNFGFINGATHATKIMAKKIEIGNNVWTCERQCFENITLLESISIPNTMTYFGSGTTGNVFQNCTNLKCVVFPKGSVVRGANCFNSCYNIRFISIPKDITLPEVKSILGNGLKNLRMLTFPEMTFSKETVAYGTYRLERFSYPGTYTALMGSFCREAYEMKEIIVPSTVTSIADYALTSTVVDVFILLPTTPPTVVNSRGLPSGGESVIRIIVPHGTLEDYQTATNWSSYAQYMEEASE